MNKQNLTIGTLTVTALILAVILIFTPKQQIVYGDTMATGGDYIMISTTPTSSNFDHLITIIDTRQNRLLNYTLDGSGSQIHFKVIGTMDMTRPFATTPGPRR